ncbi:M56 family metallopeptidase [Flavobacterium rakeshii]|uniref:M56 family metallopeptidase n=1 Tax=Flavobacterium rakeshii TaxID=1038845 RepID=UPI002E7B8D84|nr:M56 family metallopeptidase [Flavobacterium rakeshii]MEE1898416.1 M56 family metallopeptidase [Flavobacterium rakeshii]
MENLTIYMLKASGIIALFYFAYILFLKKETFFTANRWFLLSGLFTAAFLPLLTITKTVIVEPTNATPFQILMPEAENYTEAVVEEAFTINWFYVLIGIYVLISAILLVRLIIDLFRIKAIIKGSNGKKEKQYTIIDTTGITLPFSFFSYIVYNSKAVEPEELNDILKHEKVHSSQKHSADIIIGQLFTILFWFNPFMWLYKKTISQNLEFIADAEASKQVNDRKNYQKTLLKFTLNEEYMGVTNHFYQPLIKKRIMMLNTPSSKKINTFKYAFILPFMFAFVFLFQIKTEAQIKETENQTVQPESQNNIHALEITKNTSDVTLKEGIKKLEKATGCTFTLNALDRNDNGEISNIALTITGAANVKSWSTSKNTGLDPFLLIVEKNDKGEYFVEMEKIQYSADGGTEIDAPERHNNPKTGKKAVIINTATDTVTQNGVRKFTYYTKNVNFTNAVDTVYYDRISSKDVNTSTYQTTNSNQNETNFKITNADDALIFIDGKEATPAMVKSLNYINISAIDVSKKTEENVAKYGEKAKNGVIMVTTTKEKPKTFTLTTSGMGEGPFTSTISKEQQNNALVVINKTASDKTLEDYKDVLQRMGVIVKYKTIRRNKAGEIVKLKISITDDKKGTEKSLTCQDSNGISNIAIGKQNGEIKAFIQ